MFSREAGQVIGHRALASESGSLQGKASHGLTEEAAQILRCKYWTCLLRRDTMISSVSGNDDFCRTRVRGLREFQNVISSWQCSEYIVESD